MKTKGFEESVCCCALIWVKSYDKGNKSTTVDEGIAPFLLALSLCCMSELLLNGWYCTEVSLWVRAQNVYSTRSRGLSLC